MLQTTEYEQCFAKYNRGLIGWLIVKGCREAEDVAQDTWLCAWRAREKYKGDTIFWSWLWRTALNCMLQRRRYSQAGNRRDDLGESLVPDEKTNRDLSPDPEKQFAYSEMENCLTPQLVMFHIHGLTTEELATHYHLKYNVVKAKNAMDGKIAKTLLRLNDWVE